MNDLAFPLTFRKRDIMYDQLIYLEGFDLGVELARKEFLDSILKEARTFRVINGKANKCCQESFIYAEKVYNEKLNNIAKELKQQLEGEKP